MRTIPPPPNGRPMLLFPAPIATHAFYIEGHGTADLQTCARSVLQWLRVHHKANAHAIDSQQLEARHGPLLKEIVNTETDARG